jgi:putative ABC transport system permease protein
MMIWENIRVAFRSIRSNLLRSMLTLMIIAFGIMALVGILTAIDTIIYSMGSNFSSLGANSFTVQPSYSNIQSSRGGRVQRRGEPISYNQAREFVDRFDMPATTSINFRASTNSVVKYRNEKTNPTVRVYGVDESYLDVSGYEIGHGRNFSPFEVENAASRAIIGHEIVTLLFDGEPEKALNEIISIGNTRYMVVGVLKEKGSAMNSGSDRRVYITLGNARRFYATQSTTYDIDVGVEVPEMIDEAVASATGSDAECAGGCARVRKTIFGYEKRRHHRHFKRQHRDVARGDDRHWPDDAARCRDRPDEHHVGQRDRAHAGDRRA